MQKTMLIVEDDPGVAAVLREVANEVGCTLDHAEDGITGLELALQGEYDLLILDLTLPRLGGLEICKRVREQGNNVLILMLTSRGEDIDKVLGLELGADDYVTKPFSLRELVARVNALFRRARYRREAEDRLGQGAADLVFGGLRIEPHKRQVALDGKPVRLTPLEFDILVYFASRPGWVLARETINEEVLGYELNPSDTTVTTLIYRLRRKIEADPTHPRFIRAVRGMGYCFATPSEFNDE